MAKSNGKTFIKITNRDIYTEIKTIESQLKTFEDNNESAHSAILNEHEKNKGRINTVRWIATSALLIATFLCAQFLIKVI